MITFKILEYDDPIKPDDLVRNVYPASYYCNYSDDSGESTLRWHYAKFHMTAWIGKTIREYRDGAMKNNHYGVSELMIIRVPKTLTREQLDKLGMPIYMPSASTRKLFFNHLGKSNFGNIEHCPKKVKVPFGKYKGSTVEEIYDMDRKYLQWLQERVELTGELKESVDDWLRRGE